MTKKLIYSLRHALPIAILVTSMVALPVSAESGSGSAGTPETTEKIQDRIDTKIRENKVPDPKDIQKMIESHESSEEAKQKAEVRAKELVRAIKTDDSSPEKPETETEHGPENEPETESESEGDTSGRRERTEEEKKKLEDDRQKKCESRKNGIKTKGEKLGTNAVRHRESFDSLLEKAVAFKEKNGLAPENFDQLVAAAEQARQSAKLSIEALKSLRTEVDCTAENVAEQVATIKAAAEQARNDLKAYRDAIRAVFQSLENENEKKTESKDPKDDVKPTTSGEGN